MNYNTIIDAINLQITSLSAMPVLAKENSGYSPKLLTPWMRSTILPAEPFQVTIGANRIMRFNGLVQLDVFVPANTGTTSTVVDRLVTHFNNTRFILPSGLTVNIEHAWRGTSATQTDWYRTPVYLRWQCFSE